MMDTFYFFNTDTNAWCAYWMSESLPPNYDIKYAPLDPAVIAKLQKAMLNPSKNSDFIILRNKIFPGIPTSHLLIPIDSEELRFVGKDFFYCAGKSLKYGGGCYGRSCIPTKYIVNKTILNLIMTQYQYVVDYIDSMQRDESPGRSDQDERLNYVRAKKCFDSLTDDQKLYYTINGDGKYLF